MRKVAAVVVALLGLVALALAPPGSASTPLSAPVRAALDLTGAVDKTTVIPAGMPIPETARGIGPGSHLIIKFPDGTAGCTGSFVWRSAERLFLGSAGHCFLDRDESATHGPGANANVSGRKVFVCVADCAFGGMSGFVLTGKLVELGPVVYARQSTGDEQLGHDFGLVEIPAALHGHVRPAMPVFGGPARKGAAKRGELLCHYGAGVGAGETFVTMGRTAVGVSATGQEFSAAGVGAPGDSGSAVNQCTIDSSGYSGTEAVGLLTHLGLGRGNLFGTTVARAEQMATEAGLAISLVTG